MHYEFIFKAGNVMLNDYVPKVMVAGDAEQFIARVHNAGRAAKIVGVVSFYGTLDDQPYDLIKTKTLVLDGKSIELAAFKALIDQNAFDYIVFMSYSDNLKYTAFLASYNKIINSDRLVHIDTFINCVRNNFCGFNNITDLYRVLASQKIRSLLDVDAYFAGGTLYVKPITDAALTVDGIFDKPVRPIFTNVYSRYYSSVADCALRHYDAILLTAERDWESAMLKFYELSKMSEMFIVFVRNNSPLTKFADEDRWPREFIQINYNPTVNGRWFIMRKAPPKDVALYVVTHKKYSVPLPDGYKSIHAGRALKSDLGYIGDDSGRNISELNPYLNEMTAAYWIWKNTSHEIVGISHYRRFFSSKASRVFDPKNILTSAQAVNVLRLYDMIVVLEDNYSYNQYGFLINDVGPTIANTSIALAKTMMSIYQPDYVDAFDFVMSNSAVFRCNMMITRKHVFDAYCEWLFSFLLPAHAEFMKMAPLEKLSVNQKRIFGYLAERLMNIWLVKNNLRIKELPIMENVDRPKNLGSDTHVEDTVQMGDAGRGSDRASVGGRDEETRE